MEELGLQQDEEYGSMLLVLGCHEKLQQWGKAVACCKEDVERRRNLRGNNHPEYASTLDNLAVLFAKSRDLRR
jgi:hypothetical protein